MTEDTRQTRLTLIQKVKDPDNQEAWFEFHQLYWDLVIGWARRYGCSDTLAQDVFQETMVNLLRNLSDFNYDRDKGHFRSYLKTIVTRRIKDAYRRESRYLTEGKGEPGETESRLENIPDANDPGGSETDQVWLSSMLSHALRRSYKKVDPTTYKSFCLHVLEELPVEEVASELGIDKAKNIYEHKRRMLEIIKKEFQNLLQELEGMDSTQINEDLFKNALEELLSGKTVQRITLVMDNQPVKLFEQLNYIRKTFSKTILPETPGGYLVSNISGLKQIKLKDKMNIGREENCDLVLEGDGVSGLHAVISEKMGDWWINDEKSTNGVFINGKKITGEKFLKNGDILQITADFQFIFYLRERE